MTCDKQTSCPGRGGEGSEEGGCVEGGVKVLLVDDLLQKPDPVTSASGFSQI